jgi:hypothetical protein
VSFVAKVLTDQILGLRGPLITVPWGCNSLWSALKSRKFKSKPRSKSKKFIKPPGLLEIWEAITHLCNCYSGGTVTEAAQEVNLVAKTTVKTVVRTSTAHFTEFYNILNEIRVDNLGRNCYRYNKALTDANKRDLGLGICEFLTARTTSIAQILIDTWNYELKMNPQKRFFISIDVIHPEMINDAITYHSRVANNMTFVIGIFTNDPNTLLINWDNYQELRTITFGSHEEYARIKYDLSDILNQRLSINPNTRSIHIFKDSAPCEPSIFNDHYHRDSSFNKPGLRYFEVLK